MKKRIILTSVIVLLLLSSMLISTYSINIEEEFFELKMLFFGGGGTPGYALLTADFLEEINIDTFVSTDGFYIPNMFSYLKKEDDWDLAIFSLSETSSFDFRKYFTEGGNRNIFKLNSEIPYNLQSEEMQYSAFHSTNWELKKQILWDWQILLMDKILPIIPLFSPQGYYGVWNNTLGYEAKWGFSDSLPYMSFEGFHEGQDSLNKFNIRSSFWSNLNPLLTRTYDGSPDITITDLIFTSLLQWSPFSEPIKTGIIEDWISVNNNHHIFRMRDNIYWNPSYNITLRNSSSVPLNLIPDGELMRGLKGEFSNGTNQQVKAKDAVFTLLAFSNKELTDKSENYKWLSNCFVDSLDDLVFHVKLNDSLGSFKEEFYSEFWKSMSVSLLPEFFLNSTSLEQQYTEGNQSYVGLYPDIKKTPQWQTFKKSAFGTGKYMLDYSDQYDITVLQKSPFWFNKGAIDGTTQTCDFERINIKVMPDDSQSLQQFRQGIIDLLEITSFPEERREFQADSKFKVFSYRRDYQYFLAFNLNKPIIGGEDNNIWLDEPGKTEYTKALAIRKAIFYAMNRDYKDDWIINHVPNPFITDYFEIPFPIQYDHNLTLAKEWMEAGGFSYDIITLKANSNIVIAVLCVVLISIFIDKIKLKRNKQMSENSW